MGVANTDTVRAIVDGRHTVREHQFNSVRPRRFLNELLNDVSLPAGPSREAPYHGELGEISYSCSSKYFMYIMIRVLPSMMMK